MTPEALSEVHHQAFSATRAWTAAEFAALLEQTGTILTGDERSFVLARVTLDEAEILTLATAPAHRRKGLAHAALRQCEERAATGGAHHVFLEVAEDNIAARALYLKSGYNQVGRRPGYYATKDGTAVAALVLRKQLIAA